MIDFFFGLIVGGVAAVAALHFAGLLSGKADSLIEQRINAMSQAGDELVQKITSATGQVTAALEAKAAEAVAAEKADHATDLTNIDNAVGQLQAALPPLPAQ